MDLFQVVPLATRRPAQRSLFLSEGVGLYTGFRVEGAGLVVVLLGGGWVLFRALASGSGIITALTCRCIDVDC